MLGKLLIWTALLSGAVKGLTPEPKVPPEGVGIWWCPECNRWKPWENDNPPAVCFHHKKAQPMVAHYYTHSGAL